MQGRNRANVVRGEQLREWNYPEWCMGSLREDSGPERLL